MAPTIPQRGAKVWRNVTLAVVVVLLLAACGDDSGVAPPTGDFGPAPDPGAAAGILVNPTDGLVTTELGGADSFTIVLNSQPTAPVVIGIASSDSGEGYASPTSANFSTGNWFIPRTISVTGVGDGVDDGFNSYTIVTAPAASNDPNYDGIDAPDVLVTNGDFVPFLAAADFDGNLWKIDADSGEQHPFATAFQRVRLGPVGGMVYHADSGQMLAGMPSFSDCGGCFYFIDLETGSASRAAEFDQGGLSVEGMALRSDGQVFAYLQFPDQLASFDPLFPFVQPLAGVSVGCCGKGMYFDEADTLYMVDETGLHTLDQATGAATLVTTLDFDDAAFQLFDPDFPHALRINALSRDPGDGRVFGILSDDDGSDGLYYLVLLDPVTGAVTPAGVLDEPVDALAHAPDGDGGWRLLAVDSGGGLRQVDQATAALTHVAALLEAEPFPVRDISSMAFDPSDFTLYAGTEPFGSCPGCIFAIDLLTGEASLEAENFLGGGVEGMALGSDGNLLLMEGGCGPLWVVDPQQDGVAAFAHPGRDGCEGNALVVDHEERLFLADDEGFYRIDTAGGVDAFSATATFDGSYVFKGFGPDAQFLLGLDSMARHPTEERVLGIVHTADLSLRYLARVEPSTGEVTQIAQTERALDGLVLLPSVPDPPPLPVAEIFGVGCDSRITLAWPWDGSGNIFNLYWSTTPWFDLADATRIEDIPVPFAHTGLPPGEAYFYRLTVSNSTGESAPSAQAAAVVGGEGDFCFNAEYGPFANQVFLGDEDVSGPQPMGFDFTFYGNTYDTFYISSNGFIGFEPDMPSGCCQGGVIPDPAPPNNIIAIAWTDLDPGQFGEIAYETRGTEPNRRLIVNFQNVAIFAQNGDVTAQAILFEADSHVEIHTTHVSQGPVYTRGIENSDGSDAEFVPGEVSASFSPFLDGVSFDAQ